MNHLLSVDDLERDTLLQLFSLASEGEEIFRTYDASLRGRILSLFFEAESTRTLISFKSSFCRLGGNVMDVSASIKEYTEREELADVIRVLANYCDAIVARTTNEASMVEIAENSTVPVISAGHGLTEHPTTGIAQVYSIQRSIGKLSNINILIVGKLPKRGVNSFLKCLRHWEAVSVQILTAPGTSLPRTVEGTFLMGQSNRLTYIHSLDDVGDPRSIDVLFIDDSVKDYWPGPSGKTDWPPNLSLDFVKCLRDDAYITAGFPRTKLTPRTLDDDPRAHYWKKSKMSYYIRSAILLQMLRQLK